jgi:hypothetical protein
LHYYEVPFTNPMVSGTSYIYDATEQAPMVVNEQATPSQGSYIVS